MFLNKIRNIFCELVSTTNVSGAQTGKHLCRQQCVLVCQYLNVSCERYLKEAVGGSAEKSPRSITFVFYLTADWPKEQPLSCDSWLVHACYTRFLTVIG